MPNLKISELPSGNPAVSTDQIPIARSGANYRITLGSMGSVMTSLAAWQSVQTANFTATAGKGYPVNTTSGQITVTLPLIPSVGDVVAFTDYAGTFATNNLNIDPNGNNINGSSSVYIATTNRTGLQLAYVDATQGWVCYGDTSGGVLTEAFTINGIVIAGGGSGGNFNSGGGAGGFRLYASGYPLSPSPGTLETGTVTVGAGGSPTGSNSVLNTITSAGGGATRTAGGSGGGGVDGFPPASYNPGAPGNVPATDPPQGYPGGSYGGPGSGPGRSGGGGGAGGPGGVGQIQYGGVGRTITLLGSSTSSTSVVIGTGSKTFTTGIGLNYVAGEPLIIENSTTNYMYANITSYNSGTGALVVNVIRVFGSGTYTSWTISRSYGGGGEGSYYSNPNSGFGVSGGGGYQFGTIPAPPSPYTNTPGTANTGGGGGATANTPGGTGGSGVVIISIPNTASVTFSGGVTSTMTTVGTKKVYKVTATSTTSETYTVTVP